MNVLPHISLAHKLPPQWGGLGRGRHHLSNDTLSLGLQRAKALLREERREERKHEEAEAAIGEDDLTRAEFIIDSLHNGSPDDACKLKEIRINLRQQNKSLSQMSSVQEQTVRAIAADSAQRPCHQARAMLREAYGEHDREIIILPGQNQLKMAYKPAEEENKPLNENHNLMNFPNPFSDYTSVEAFVAKGVREPKLILFNVLGVEIKRYPLVEGYNIVTVLQEDIPKAGVYLYALMGDEKVLAQRRMIILK